MTPTGTSHDGESIYGEQFADGIHSRLHFSPRGLSPGDDNDDDFDRRMPQKGQEAAKSNRLVSRRSPPATQTFRFAKRDCKGAV